jgi:hypothetical protein
VNTIIATDRPQYIVRVVNLGESWQLRLQVRLVFDGGARPALKTLSPLAPGAVGSVTLTAPTPTFVRPIPMQVMVVPVPGETVVTNNARTYRVQYELQ